MYPLRQFGLQTLFGALASLPEPVPPGERRSDKLPKLTIQQHFSFDAGAHGRACVRGSALTEQGGMDASAPGKKSSSEAGDGGDARCSVISTVSF